MTNKICLLLTFYLLTCWSCSSKALLVSKVDQRAFSIHSLEHAKIYVQLPTPTFLEDKELASAIKQAFEANNIALANSISDASHVFHFFRVLQVHHDSTYIPQLVTQQSSGLYNGKPYSSTSQTWVSTPYVHFYSVVTVSCAVFKVNSGVAQKETVWEGVISTSAQKYQKHTENMMSQLVSRLGENFEGKVNIEHP